MKRTSSEVRLKQRQLASLTAPRCYCTVLLVGPKSGFSEGKNVSSVSNPFNCILVK